MITYKESFNNVRLLKEGNKTRVVEMDSKISLANILFE